MRKKKENQKENQREKLCENCKHENYCDWYFIYYRGTEYANKPGKCPKSRKGYARKWYKFGWPK